ncbi:hypothetical protein B0T17DRAFT_534211 [Bombardia bombarda]|uniref:Uncharacterized protein n=1 Tax=Bombardia bombarda TaxID=252184 RepID=A0AA40C1G9_9PEZI|nr:hypothetical protein B0T17DRAFT_534211 [Bombardia bombarda]
MRYATASSRTVREISGGGNDRKNVAEFDQNFVRDWRLKARRTASNLSHASTVLPENPSPSTQHHQQQQQRPRIPSVEMVPPPSFSSELLSNAYRTRRGAVHKGASFVIAEPLILPSSQLMPQQMIPQHANPGNNLSSSTFSTYATPPEYPSPPSSYGRGSPDTLTDTTQSHDEPRKNKGGHVLPSMLSRSTFSSNLHRSGSGSNTNISYATTTTSGSAGGRDSSSSGVQSQSYSQSQGLSHSHSLKRTPAITISRQKSQWSMPSSSGQAATPHIHRMQTAYSAMPLSSSEYIERYQPGAGMGTSNSTSMGRGPQTTTVTTMPSPATTIRREPSGTIGLKGQVVAKMKRSSSARAEPTMGLVSEETAGGSGGGGGGGGGGDNGNGRGTTKRRSVQAELRRLFGR